MSNGSAPQKATSDGVSLVPNARVAARAAPWTPEPLSAARFDEAGAAVAALPGYEPTPLRRLTGLAQSLGLGDILYKDESGRFGLGSFKPLGGAYATARAVLEALRRQDPAQSPTLSDVASGRWRAQAAAITIATATDGNHGRAVAWGARAVGAQARVYVHERVSAARRAAIEALGATVVGCSGGYDDSVARAFSDAEKAGWRVVQDTSIGDYRSVPLEITHGYGVLGAETVSALEAEGAPPPTHAIVQAGVGGVASAMAAQFHRLWGAARPRFITLEPTTADCVARSLAAGRPTPVPGDAHSAMAGLACGVISDIAWEVLATGADAALTLDDAWAFEGMRRLAAPLAGDPPVVAGECAGGAVGALMALAQRPDLRQALGLDARSRVFLLGTEGATDPEIYVEAVGRTPEAVRAGAAPRARA